jgi:glycosyltransferase involved in cell wall biosynthesis
LRIAFYAPRASFLEPKLSLGGDPIFLHSLFAALRQRGHDIKVASRMNVRDLARGKVSPAGFAGEALSVWREMRRFSPDAWLIYSPSRTYPDPFGWWQRPRRYVLLGARTWQSQELPRSWRWLFALLHRVSLRQAHRVAAFRPSTARNLRALGVPDQQLSILPPAGRTWDDLPSPEEARCRLGLPRGTPIVLCMSRLTKPNEGKTESVLDLLRVLERLNLDALLVLVGDGPGRERVEKAASELVAEGRVRLVGATQHPQWFYAACDFYAFPDADDRPRLAVLETQGCARPVVTMRTPSAELTVDVGRSGLLADSLEEFQDYLAALCCDKPLCESMGQAAREYISKFHSIEVRAQQIEDLLLPGPSS